MQDNKKTLDSKKIEENCEKTIPLIRNNILIGINRSLDAGMTEVNQSNQKEHYQNALILANLHRNLGNKKMNKLVDILNTKTSFIIVAALCAASLVYIFN